MEAGPGEYVLNVTKITVETEQRVMELLEQYEAVIVYEAGKLLMRVTNKGAGGAGRASGAAVKSDARRMPAVRTRPIHVRNVLPSGAERQRHKE